MGKIGNSCEDQATMERSAVWAAQVETRDRSKLLIVVLGQSWKVCENGRISQCKVLVDLSLC